MSEPLPLSLVIIARDAAHELADCLASAAFAAETIVVDSGSSDDTAAVAARSGARVIAHAWEGFGPQKNFAVAQAAHDWVLCLDADERVTPELEAAIRALFAGGRAGGRRGLHHRAPQPLPGPLACARRRLPGLEHPAVRPPARSLVRRRGPRKGRRRRSGRELRGDLLHASAESIDAYIAKQNRYTSAQADGDACPRRTRQRRANDAVAGARASSASTCSSSGFLDGAAGFAHIAIGAFASFLKYAKLRALQEGGRPR